MHPHSTPCANLPSTFRLISLDQQGLEFCTLYRLSTPGTSRELVSRTLNGLDSQALRESEHAVWPRAMLRRVALACNVPKYASEQLTKTSQGTAFWMSEENIRRCVDITRTTFYSVAPPLILTPQSYLLTFVCRISALSPRKCFLQRHSAR